MGGRRRVRKARRHCGKKQVDVAQPPCPFACRPSSDWFESTPSTTTARDLLSLSQFTDPCIPCLDNRFLWFWFLEYRSCRRTIFLMVCCDGVVSFGLRSCYSSEVHSCRRAVLQLRVASRRTVL